MKIGARMDGEGFAIYRLYDEKEKGNSIMWVKHNRIISQIKLYAIDINS